MTQAGGPAAINGFLYQIIQHIRWLASVTLSRELNGQEIKNARIVLEPHYGGDASLEASGIFLVEQYKTRKNGTWSVSNIISILRDLRAAVPSSLPKKALYRFVTDGRAGRLNSFYDFLAEIKSVEKLDDLTDCNREYFDRLIVDTRNCKLPSDTKTKECAIVFHLLSNFEMEFSFDAVTSITEIEKFFRLLSPNLGEEREMREHLVGVLLEELSKGATNLDRVKIISLFRRVGLSPERLGRITTLSETMSELTRHRLANIKYNSKQDVRSIPEWPEDKSVLLITGESGSGKSWQLARLLEEYAKARKIFTLVFSANTIEEVLSRIARDLWQTGLGETSDLTLGAVSNFLCELMPDTAIKAIVAVDDVQDIGLARNLLSQDWVSWNMRLILTVPYSVGRSLQLNDNNNAHVHRINNFSVDELDTLLKINGQRWSDLPRDLGKLLCSPILASIFLKLPYNSIQNALHSEYEIFEKFWLRIIEKGRSGDEGIVTALADYFYQGKPYPLPRSIWSHVGLDGLALERLDAAGWLHCSDNGEVAFAHDRLLNWVVAKSLVYQFQSKKLPVADLGVFLIGKNDENRHIRRRLNYVTMDTFWLLAEAEQNLETLDQLIVQLEGSRDFGSYGENFYTRLLPTLGQRAVTILLYRLNSIIADSNDDYRISLIGKAFANLAHQKSVDLESPIDSLLKNPCWSWQKVAIAILKVAPDASRLDRLWEIHQQCYKAFEAKTANDSHRDYQDCFSALRAAIALNPDWLHHRIIRADANAEPVSELGYQLNVLEHIEAFPIWKETRDVLMEKTPASKSRSLIHCIARFFDYEKTDFVIRHLSSSTDSSSMSALATLSVLDPLAAINRLTEVQESESYFSRNLWLPVLLRAQPELTRQRILELASNESRGHRRIEDLFSERPDEIDVAMLEFVLHSLEEELQKHLNADTKDEPYWLSRSLDFLGRITNPDLLATLEAKAGGKLEGMIADVACSRLNTNSRTLDSIRENARRVLILLGGDAIITLIKQELDSEHYWVRHGGLNWAFVHPDDNIANKLAEIASRPVTYDENGKSEQYLEFYQAITALAAIGNDTVLLEALNHSGIVNVPKELVKFRSHRGRIPKKLTKPALQILQNSTSSEVKLLNALITAWLSNDADFIPAIRSILTQADLEGRVASYACIALEELGDSSDEFMGLAKRLARTESNSTWGLNALLKMGKHGFELAAELLEMQDINQSIEHEDQIIRALYENRVSRQKSIDAAVNYCQQPVHLFHDSLYDIAAEANEPNLREKILDVAFTADSISPTQQLRAIEGLAKFNVTRAVEAIEQAIRNYPNLERELCYLLVRNVPEFATEKLINLAIIVQRESFSRVAGQSLRKIDPRNVSCHIIKHLNGSNSSERKVTIELASWLPVTEITDALGHLTDHENFSEVRLAALVALEHHRRETNIRMLFSAFSSAIPKRQWSLMIVILDAADPYLLTDTNDPLWLGNILTDKIPAIFSRHANSVLSNRKRREK